jgi:hypothetical protein
MRMVQSADAVHYVTCSIPLEYLLDAMLDRKLRFRVSEYRRWIGFRPKQIITHLHYNTQIYHILISF